MDELLKRKLKKVADNQADINLAQLDATLDVGDKIEQLSEELQSKITEGVIAIEMDAEDLNRVFSDVTEVNDSISEEIVSVLKEIRDKEEKEYPEHDDTKQVELLTKIAQNSEKEVKVTVQAPDVVVDVPVVEINQDEVVAELKNISNLLSQEEPETIEKTEIVDDKGKTVNFKNLFDSLSERIGTIKIGGGGAVLSSEDSNKLTGIKPLSGSSANGTRELTSANTWYAVPSTVPTSAYNLIVTLENAAGDIRWGYSNSGTPSATNGNRALDSLERNLAGGQVIYFASSVAGDDVNWTTKII